MHVKSEFIILIFYTLGFSVVTFHMPNLDVNSNIETDSSQTNTGLIHSSIRNNWSQSLNIGSVSIAATIIILFVALCMHLRTAERLNILSKNVESNQRDIRRLAANKGRRQLSFKPSSANQAETGIWGCENSCVFMQVWFPSSGLPLWRRKDFYPIQLWPDSFQPMDPCSQVD